MRMNIPSLRSKATQLFVQSGNYFFIILSSCISAILHWCKFFHNEKRELYHTVHLYLYSDCLLFCLFSTFLSRNMDRGRMKFFFGAGGFRHISPLTLSFRSREESLMKGLIMSAATFSTVRSSSNSINPDLTSFSKDRSSSLYTAYQSSSSPSTELFLVTSYSISSLKRN